MHARTQDEGSCFQWLTSLSMSIVLIEDYMYPCKMLVSTAVSLDSLVCGFPTHT